MAADLKVVEDERPAAVTADLIAAALERFKAANETPLEYHDPVIGGVFRYRKVTGAEMQDILRLATKADGTQDQQRLIFLLVNRASVEPKVTSALWGQLLQLPPQVAGGLSEAIQVANGRTADPVADAGKDWSESQS